MVKPEKLTWKDKNVPGILLYQYNHASCQSKGWNSQGYTEHCLHSCQCHTVSHEGSMYVQKGSTLNVTLGLHFTCIPFFTDYA